MLNLPAGDYTLTVTAGDSPAPTSSACRTWPAAPLTPGTPVSGTEPGQRDRPVPLRRRRRRPLLLRRSRPAPIGRRPRWRLIDPYGNVLFNAVFDNTSAADAEQPALTQSGTYTLLLEGNIGDTAGNYTFNVRPIVTTSTPLTIGNVVSGAIATAGQQDRYTFTLPGAALLYFDSLANIGNLSWTLTGPTGPVVSTRDFINGDGLVLNLPSGNYTLTVDGTRDATGAYSFRLLDFATAPLDTGNSRERLSESRQRNRTVSV